MMPPPLSVGAGLFTPEKWSHLALPFVRALRHDDALGNLTNPRVTGQIDLLAGTLT
jgi:hypothetical protein